MKLVEACGECSFLEYNEETGSQMWCGKTGEYIPIDSFNEGIIPSWCPLPEE